jgi:hypothetical protein
MREKLSELGISVLDRLGTDNFYRYTVLLSGY